MFIDIEAKETLEYLIDLEDKLDDPSPLMADISDVMFDAVEENFRQEGRPEAWADLTDHTKAKREKQGKWPGKILQRNQAGLASAMSQFHSRDEAGVANNKIYAATMNFGAEEGEFGETSTGRPIPFGDIPARPFMTLAENDLTEIREIAMDYISI